MNTYIPNGGTCVLVSCGVLRCPGCDLSFDCACNTLGWGRKSEEHRQGTSVRGRCMARSIGFLGQCGFLSLATVSLWGQFTRGALVGRVSDPSGAVVPKAQVKLVNQNTNIPTNSETSPQGDY